jgi:DNA-directed RNA polymerase subunit RPC12/RpoP
MDINDHWDPDYSCPKCGRSFASENAMEQHQQALNHWKYDCETCSRTFRDVDDCDEHMQTNGHFRNYCQPCDRSFINENALKMV